MRTLALIAATIMTTTANAQTIKPGTYRATLDSPSGQIPFIIEVGKDRSGEWGATVVNGREQIPVPVFEVSDGGVVLAFPVYDSRIEATVSDDGAAWSGTWTLARSSGRTASVPFSATLGVTDRFDKRFPPESTDPQTGGRVLVSYRQPTLPERWVIRFESSDDPAVGVFEQNEMDVTGTILTTTGDYRYLAGVYDYERRLRLSCFDGAHAFLFEAELLRDVSLEGVFQSGDWWTESWTAVPDPDASLPDAMDETRWVENADLSSLVFKDTLGRPVTLEQFEGTPRLIEIFGTWCPNCADAGEYLVELDANYRDRGLQVIALAFELSDDHERAARQVKRFADHHGTQYPIYIAGLSNKDKASEAFPVLDRVRSYPTFIFIDKDDTVRAIWTGFSGPATGAEHERLRDRFETLIESMLSE